MLATLKAIWRTLAGQRLLYGAAVAALITASCFLYLAPLIPQAVLDGVIVPGEVAPSRSTRWVIELLGGRAFVRANLWVPGLIFVIITVLAGGFTYLRGRWSAKASERIVRGLRDRIYDHLQHLSCGYFHTAETGDLIQRCTSDVETLRKFLADQVVEIGRATVMLIVPIPLMLLIDPRMTGVSLLLIPFICAFSFFCFRQIRLTFTEADEAEGKMTARIQENLTGIRVVRAFARQDFEREQFDVRNAAHRGLDYKLYLLLARFWSVSDLLCFLQKGLVVFAGVYWLSVGSLQVGAFFYFVTAVNMFIWPVRQMGRILSDLGKALVALERLDEIMAVPLEDHADVSVSVPDLGGELVFDSVSFSHGDAAVLHDVSFTVPEGKTLAILGPSGSGKTTIVNLLLRLYDYSQGSIRIGGHELSTLDRKALRRRMAAVLQEPFLYSKTLGENARLGAPSATEEDMHAATQAACVHETVLGFEDGYETRIGERGVTLSGGQRQRLALARALLQRPAVLILDDALSAVDTETERSILSSLAGARRQQTTVVIAHRLSTLMEADEILVLDDGRVVQRGTHDSLRDAPGPYRRLWEIQTATEPTPKPEPLTTGSGRLARSA
jgi:ATP-binding cassette, subfamily B, bacterial